MSDKIEGFGRIQVRIVGTAPLLMHNGQLADPLNSWTQRIKEITGKNSKKRTDNDILLMRELEWNGGMYHDDQIGPFIPSELIEGVLRDGAKKYKKGLANDIVMGTQVDEAQIPLEYQGPRDRTSLYGDAKFVDVRGAKLKKSATVIRIRPKFPYPWFASFTLLYVKSTVGFADLGKALVAGGTFVGIGDYRPKFGRFTVQTFKEG
jgi:hypothetical protein